MAQKAFFNKFTCQYMKENDNSTGFGLVDDLLGRWRKRVQQGTALNYPTSAELDDYLIALAVSANTTAETIDLTVGKYSKTFRTTASNAAMITLAGKNKTIIVKEHLSKEIIKEGDFSNGGAAWQKVGTATVNTGKGYIAGVGYIAQASAFGEKPYFFFRMKYTVTDRVGSVQLWNNNYTIEFPSTNGLKNYILNAVGQGAGTSLYMQFDSGTDTISLDDFSLKAIGDKTFTALGDSIASSINSYVVLISRDRTWALHNFGVSGNNVANHLAGQVLSASNNDADTIIFQIGTNDSEAIGDQAAIQNKAEQAIIDLKISNTRAKLYWVNVLPRWTDIGGGTVYDRTNIRATILAACTAQNITCWDTFSDPWITSADTLDGLHPNATGMSKIKTRIDALLP